MVECLVWMGSAQHCYMWIGACLMLHHLGSAPSKGMEDSLRYSLLIVLALMSSILNDTLQSLCAFLTGIITGQYILLQTKAELL